MPNWGDFADLGTGLALEDTFLVRDATDGAVKEVLAQDSLRPAAAMDASSNLVALSNLVLPTTSGTGVKKGTTASSAFGWRDLIGDVTPKTSGANSAQRNTWRGNVAWFSFGTNDLADLVYHFPHDWVPGTDVYIHVHWGHNGTNISGSLVINFYSMFARGFNQASLGTFPAEVNTTLTVGSLTIGNTPQYRHRTDEIQLSAASPTANQLDTDDFEVDGILMIGMKVTTIPSITGGAGEPFIFTVDLHYQSMGVETTKNKAPDFYT